MDLELPSVENNIKTSPFNLVEYLDEDINPVNINIFEHLKISLKSKTTSFFVLLI